jgi:hypothetical protein
MQTTSTDRGSTGVLDRSSKASWSPIDDRTYNVMQALVSKLEAIEAYTIYAEDEGGQIFHELIEDERRHAERLVQELKSCLADR